MSPKTLLGMLCTVNRYGMLMGWLRNWGGGMLAPLLAHGAADYVRSRLQPP